MMFNPDLPEVNADKTRGVYAQPAGLVWISAAFLNSGISVLLLIIGYSFHEHHQQRHLTLTAA
jgi:hypothetical protein